MTMDLDRVRARAEIDQQRSRVRDLLDERYDGTLATILHTDGQLADIVRLTIGAVILDIRQTAAVAPDAGWAVLHAWAQIAEPEL